MRKMIAGFLLFIVLPACILAGGVGLFLRLFLGYQVAAFAWMAGLGIPGSIVLALLLGIGRTDKGDGNYEEESDVIGALAMESNALIVGDAFEPSECDRVEDVARGEYEVRLVTRKGSGRSKPASLTLAKGSFGAVEETLPTSLDVETYASLRDQGRVAACVDVEPQVFLLIDASSFEEMKASRTLRRCVRKATHGIHKSHYAFLPDADGPHRGIIVSTSGDIPMYPIVTRKGEGGEFELYCPFETTMELEEEMLRDREKRWHTKA